ncbi:MAG: YtxH domain-containing protein [Flavobacteriaceae bacterium]|nr:YtxH domain-containing protein [Flavobacteriaceae bacterium]
MRRNNETGAIIGSLFIGALAGAVAALLLAPQSGRETRDLLVDEADKLKREIEKYANDFSDKAKQVKAELEDKLRRTEAELRDIEDELGV